jgi:hypothetical protein
MGMVQSSNSLDFEDMDDIDLLEDVESAFDIKIEDMEAERITNLGDLHDLIIKKTSASGQQRNKCHSAMAFYRLRSVMRNFTQTKVTPATLVGDVLNRRQHEAFSRKLSEMHGLNLKTDHNLFFLVVSGLFLLAFFVALFLKSKTANSLLLATIASFVAFMLPILPKTFCSKYSTFADVARMVEQQSIGKLGKMAGGLDENLVWPWLVQYLKDCFSIKQPIDRKTVFFKGVH